MSGSMMSDFIQRARGRIGAKSSASLVEASDHHKETPFRMELLRKEDGTSHAEGHKAKSFEVHTDALPHAAEGDHEVRKLAGVTEFGISSKEAQKASVDDDVAM